MTFRTEHPNAVWFLGSTAACSLVGVLACLSVTTLAGMYVPGPGAWVAGLACTFLPAFLMNRWVTSSFRRIHFPDAPEWRSFFGALGLVGVVVLGLLWFGAAGLPGHVAVEEACCRAGAPFGLLTDRTGTYLDAYPRSRADGYVIVAPDVGWGDSHRVMARDDDGVLKAMYVPERGTVLDGVLRPARVTNYQRGGDGIRLQPLQASRAEPKEPARREQRAPRRGRLNVSIPGGPQISIDGDEGWLPEF